MKLIFFVGANPADDAGRLSAAYRFASAAAAGTLDAEVRVAGDAVLAADPRSWPPSTGPTISAAASTTPPGRNRPDRLPAVNRASRHQRRARGGDRGATATLFYGLIFVANGLVAVLGAYLFRHRPR